MKQNRQNILIGTTFLFLIALLFIQISYIYRAALLEERNFNHIVKMALKGARDEIGMRVPKCAKMENYLCGKGCASSVVFEKTKEVDSIIKANLAMYNIELPYRFEIIDSKEYKRKRGLFGEKCYVQNLNGLLERNGIKIRVEFPGRDQFLIAQLGTVFVISILAIVFIMISFIITIRIIKREKMQMVRLTDFINNMVHEFQTPLSNIQFATNLIRKKNVNPSNEKIQDYTGVILDENQKLKAHVENILKVACTDECRVEIEEVNMISLIEELVESYRGVIENSSGSIELNANALNGVVEGDRTNLRMVLSNLLDNAIKYSISTPTVAVTTFNKSEKIIVQVQDQGIGIPNNELDLIFDKHYRVSTGDVHNVKGFGLGLTFVKKIVELYKGKVEVESSLGKGSIFSVELPVKSDVEKN